jgi:signal transduction histidine kinase/CheY-like chemotaxis protein
MRIRSHLILLAAGAMLPLLAFAGLLSFVLVRQDSATVERGALDRARAMMTSVDAQLRGSLTTIDALAASSALASGDLRAFAAEASRVLETQRAWSHVTLLDASGERLIDVPHASVPSLPRLLDPTSLARVLSTKRPVIGDVDVAQPSGPGIPLRVPLLHDGAVKYVLTAIVRPASFEDLIQEQRLPHGWVSGIVDSSGRFVARIPARPAGDFSSAQFRAAIARAPEGWYRGLTVDAKDTFTAHIRSEFSGWSIGLAIPADIVLSGVHKTWWLIGSGVLASIAAAMAIVALSGRRIAQPIVSLATVARMIGSGEHSPVAVGGAVREVREVAVALRDADAAVRERQSLIQRERDVLQTADRAKDEFIAALSHELRNPLAAMTAASHILRIVEPTQAAAGDARGVIERQTKHMTRMIEDLLDMSRIIMGKANLLFETFDLAQLAEHTVDAWRAAGRFAGRSASVLVEPAWVTADRTRTEQILSNLLDNAVKFTPQRTVITVAVACVGDVVVLSVADDGPGMTPELAERAFDVFVQGEQGVGRSRGGMGVGLTLVKRLAELQGGSASVTSEGPGKGTTFTVRLPASTPAVATGVPPAAPQHGTPRRVLIVEDNRDARDMVRQALELCGHQVFEASDGATGVALARDCRPDVAVVDIGLPDISGYDVARRIRAEVDERLTLIALTGYGQPEDRERAYAAGFDVHLVKPVTLERLDDAIANSARGSHAAIPADD